MTLTPASEHCTVCRCSKLKTSTVSPTEFEATKRVKVWHNDQDLVLGARQMIASSPPKPRQEIQQPSTPKVCRGPPPSSIASETEGGTHCLCYMNTRIEPDYSFRRHCEIASVSVSAIRYQTANDLPQEQLLVALGLLNTNFASISLSTQSTSVPTKFVRSAAGT